MPVFALWSAPRARSTAFFRSMLERGDLVCVHEPFSDLAGLGETDVDGRPFATIPSFLAWLRDETDGIDVFLKDTPNDRHRALLADERFLAETKHALLIRRPEEIAASHRAVEPAMTIDSIGLELIATLDAAVVDAGGLAVVIDSDDLVAHPEATMRAYCATVGLPFLSDALTWAPGQRHEWRRSARWHVDASESSGFVRREQRHERTVETDEELARFAAHHRPFYESLLAKKLVVTT